MVDVTEILQHWYAGRPKVEVARSLGVDAKTVRRYVAPADGLRIDPQAAGHLDLRPARVPVLQDLRDIDHGERPPCHLGPPSEADEEHTQLEGPEAEPRRTRRRLGKTLIEEVGNYLIVAGP